MPISFSYFCQLTPRAPAVSREQILNLQDAMLPLQCELPPVQHHFARGMYGRQMDMPAGMVVIGKCHRHEHLLMVLKGRATVVDEFGRYEVEAGFIQVSRPGAKRALLAHEDTTFVTVHLNADNTADLDAIEAEHIKPESEEFRALSERYRKELMQ